MNNLGSVQLLKGLWRLYFSTRSSAPLSRWVSNWSSRRDKFNGTICNQIYWKIRIFNFQLKVVNCVHKSQFLHNFPSYLSAKKIVKTFWSFCTYSWLKWIKVWKSLRHTIYRGRGVIREQWIRVTCEWHSEDRSWTRSPAEYVNWVPLALLRLNVTKICARAGVLRFSGLRLAESAQSVWAPAKTQRNSATGVLKRFLSKGETN